MLSVKALQSKILRQILNLEAGRLTGADVPANNYLDRAISFTKPFDAAPIVVPQIQSTSTSATMGSITVSAINITKTGFTVRVFNNTSAQRSPAISWVAINLI